MFELGRGPASWILAMHSALDCQPSSAGLPDDCLAGPSACVRFALIVNGVPSIECRQVDWVTLSRGFAAVVPSGRVRALGPAESASRGLHFRTGVKPDPTLAGDLGIRVAKEGCQGEVDGTES
jgi:hypothetical protein